MEGMLLAGRRRFVPLYLAEAFVFLRFAWKNATFLVVRRLHPHAEKKAGSLW